MTETVSKVYDLAYPSPATLKEISSIVVAVDLWRKEIWRSRLGSEIWHEFDLTKSKIRLKNVIPNLPSAIYSFLEEYIATFRESIVQWLDYYYNKVDGRPKGGSDSVLIRFDDFAWDWDGTIHYSRTAKRMILCDRFDEYEKFKIACFYCFEDDIKRIWPSVREKMGDLDISDVFCKFPQLYYWICHIRNELHKVPASGNESVDQDEMMIYKCQSDNQSCMMYFWNRLRPDRQSRIDIYKLIRSSCLELFVRFMLPTLNDNQLEIFVAANGFNMMRYYVLRKEPVLPYVLPAWMCIRDKMNESDFITCVHQMLVVGISLKEHFSSESVEYLFIEIWNSAPQHLKQAALNDVLPNKMLLDIRNTSTYYRYYRRATKFLITVLEDATFEERNAFWLEHWRILICGTPIEDLIKLMKLSFRNENEITLFKENIMSAYENIAEWCVRLLNWGSFEALNDFLSVCYPDVGKIRQLKRRLLRSNYMGENSELTMIVLENHLTLLNDLIDDAFQDAADLGVEFRNEFASSSAFQNCLLMCTRYGDFVPVMEFVDALFSEERAVMSAKKGLFERFKEVLFDGTVRLKGTGSDDLQGFLIWLLGSEGEVIKFKQALPVEDIFRAMMQAELNMKVIIRKCGDGVRIAHCDGPDGFLMWYFNGDKEEIKKFEEQLSDELKMLISRKRRRIV